MKWMLLILKTMYFMLLVLEIDKVCAMWAMRNNVDSSTQHRSSRICYLYSTLRLSTRFFSSMQHFTLHDYRVNQFNRRHSSIRVITLLVSLLMSIKIWTLEFASHCFVRRKLRTFSIHSLICIFSLYREHSLIYVTFFAQLFVIVESECCLIILYRFTLVSLSSRLLSSMMLSLRRD